ncbi:SMP-30/gluconolactonase/LRE family protein [Embleya scabrispora]|uniref:SMP-30/gluconolactonase/LRE family protein n=1 Tax=Embleya scabrispora TaxID=159449 RepID=UPI001914877D|nr:SMP-30/gluconolactonase/LRE family protein [Embleya scabrispora]
MILGGSVPGAGEGPVPLPPPAATLGESPCWDARSGRLLWVDIPAGRVHYLVPDTDRYGWYDIGRPVSAIVPRAVGGFGLAVREGFAVLEPDGTVRIVAHVEADRPGNRMNDGACDRAGRFFAGTKAEDDTPGAGALYRLDPPDTAHPSQLPRLVRVFAEVTNSNGIAWSPDERSVYYVDTGTGRIDVCAYDPADATVSDRRPFTEIPPEAGLPDGLTVDADGGVWVALWEGGALRRYTPDGRLDRTLPVPVRRVTNCAFGGPDLDVLYVTTAATDDREPLGGRLFAFRPGIRGLAAHPYRG